MQPTLSVTFFDMDNGVNGVTFAATYPHLVRSLILNNLRPSIPQGVPGTWPTFAAMPGT